MKVELSYKSDERFTTINETGNKVEIDMLPSDQKQNQSPTQLLLSGLVACAAIDIVSMVKKKRRTFVDIRGIATGERREEYPRGFTKIHLKYVIISPDLTNEEAERIVDLATTKYCSVAASVSAEQTHSCEVVRS